MICPTCNGEGEYLCEGTWLLDCNVCRGTGLIDGRTKRPFKDGRETERAGGREDRKQERLRSKQREVVQERFENAARGFITLLHEMLEGYQ